MTGTGHWSRDIAVNRPLRRVVAAWFLFTVTFHGVWIAVLAYAYGRGGATESGVVALVQVLPAGLIAPLLATIADRQSPALLLKAGYLVQAIAMAAVSIGMFADAPVGLTYGSAMIMTLAAATTRPAQATLTPSLTRDARQLAAANVAYGWLDSVGLVAGGLLTALGLAFGSAGLVLAMSAGLGVGQVALVWTIRAAPIATRADVAPNPFAVVGDGLRVLVRHQRARVLVGLIAALYVVVGALDVLFVVVPVDVLHDSVAWVGYLTAGFGVGGVLAGTVTTRLIGRRMRGPILASVVLISATVALVAASAFAAVTLALVVLAGVGKAVLLVATQTLLQRVVPADLIGRIFGVVEGLISLGVAAGSVLVPLLVGAGGPDLALLGTAAVLPLTALVGWRALAVIDSGATVPVVEIALLRSMPHFAVLPVPALEALANAATRRELSDGDVLVTEGEAGEDFYAVSDGRLAIWSGDRRIATRGRADGIGEIALLRRVPRTVTVTADGPVSVLAIQGRHFLASVTGHDATYDAASAVAADYLRAADPSASGRRPESDHR